jgi:hypothetical protein
MSSTTPPIIERTTSRGTVDLKFPGLEASFPATNRSIMIILIAAFTMIIIVVPVCFYEVFNARPESLETVGDIIGGRKPAKAQDGIEIIEPCPPCPRCPTCEEMGCSTPAQRSQPPAMISPTPR